MTGPTSGFADWQQYASWRGQYLFNGGANPGAGTAQTLGQWSIGNYASVRIRVFTVANGADILLWGMDDQFGSQQHLIKKWVSRLDTSINALAPIPTPWIKLEVQSEPANSWNGYIQLQPVNVAADKVHYYGFNTFVNVLAQAYNPAQIRNHYPPVLLPGPAFIWADSNAAGVDVIYQAWTYDSAGNDETLISTWRRISVDGLHDNFEIPERSWRMKVWNNTAANQVVSFTVTSRGNLT